MLKKLALFFLISFLFTLPALAEPFSDVPQNHWSYDAVNTLQEKGLVEGYPDGLFKGDRPMTRYEMAMVVARLIAKLQELEVSIPPQPDLSPYATKKDLETVNALIKEYKNELDALGVRVSSVEDSLGKLTARVQELERIKVSGNFNCTGITIGYSPGSNNTASFGNPNPNPATQPPNGPSTIYDNDRFLNFRLYQGFAIVSKLELNIAAKISDNVKAGGTFEAYSAFGDKDVADFWGLIPSYNPRGAYPAGSNFYANLSTLWFNTEGNWKFKGSFGDYRLNKVSDRLFAGPRSLYAYGGKVLLPINGVNICGTLYEKVDVEAFMAKNINAFIDFNDPTLTNPLYYFGAPGATHIQSNRSWYPLAIPYNNGVGASHVFTYGKADPGQYDNYLYGIWAGYNFLEGNGHVEGAYLRLGEDYASNPNNTLGVNPKATTYFGINGYYLLMEKKLKIFGEFNQTRFNYNLLNPSSENRAGNLFNIGAKYKFDNLSIEGKYLWIAPNYDPFGYHITWEKAYLDGHHDGWNWKFGSLANATRVGIYRPNRTGFDLGADWTFGDKKQGVVYGEFAYLQQTKPTMITADEDTFQKYDFLTGNAVASTIGANIYGNQDLDFTINDPAKGKEYIIDIGGKYSFTDKIHVWGSFERYTSKREFQNLAYQQDLSLSYFYTGLTYDMTDKFSLQGSFIYAKGSGTDQANANIDWSQVIPGAGMRYMFNDNTELLLDYKFYKFTDNATAVAGTNDYHANKVMTRLVIKF